MGIDRVGAVAVVVATSLALGSCVTNSASVYVAGALAIDTSSCAYATDSDLLISTTVDQHYIESGVPVTVAFLVQSLLRKRNFNIASDPSTVLINEAEIELRNTAGELLDTGGDNPYIVDVPGGVIEGSSDGVSPGEGIVSIPILPSIVLQAIPVDGTSSSVIAKITMRGRTNGNLNVEGGPFTWMIQVFKDGARGVSCDPTSDVLCCSGGVNQEFYCTNDESLGLCAPKN